MARTVREAGSGSKPGGEESIDWQARYAELERTFDRFQLRAVRAQLIAKIGMFEWDLETDEVWWSRGIPALLGLSEGEGLDSRLVFRRYVHPEDQERLQRSIERVASGEEVSTSRYRLLLDDGTQRECFVETRLERDPAGRDRVTGIIEDVTERRRAEEALRRSQEALARAHELAQLGSAEVGLDSQTLRWSPEIYRILGMQPGEIEPCFDTYVQHVHPEDRERFLSRYEQLAAGNGVPVWAYRIVRPDGEVRCIEGRASLFESGSEPMILGTIQDVTDRELAQRQAREADHRLELAQRTESLGLLAGGIAHDFNNLLGRVVANLELARLASERGEPGAQHLEAIREAAQAGAGLAQQILAYAGRRPLERGPVDLNEVVCSIEGLLRTSLGPRLRLEWAPGATLPRVEADASQVQQILINLVGNASEAIGDRPGTITVRTGLTHCDAYCLDGAILGAGAAPGEYAYLEVSDDGCGMDAETLERAFEPFFTTRAAGHGLGLCAVLGIVRAHGGLIDVQSELGRGSTLRVLLPPAAARSERSRAVELPESSATALRVLLVDDDVALREAAQTLLELSGYSVVSAGTGGEALEIFRKRPGSIDCAIVDLTMPGLGGIDTVKSLREIRPELAVVVCSGFDERAVADTADAVGAFLQKPYSRSQLIDAIARAVGSASSGGL